MWGMIAAPTEKIVVVHEECGTLSKRFFKVK